MNDSDPGSSEPLGARPRGNPPLRQGEPRTRTRPRPDAAVPSGCVCAWSVSVVLAGYGGDIEGLERSIYSVLRQTLGDAQVVIVGDAAMVERAGRLTLGGRLQVVEADEGGDRSVDRERGLRAAGGELVAFLEPGDLWFEDHLERAAACFVGREDVGLALAPVAYVSSDADTYVREPDSRVLQSAGGGAPLGCAPSDLLPLWTISGFVARRAVLADQGLGSSMLFNRAAKPASDALKWSDFSCCWGIRGDAGSPRRSAFEVALAQCLSMLLVDHASELEEESWTTLDLAANTDSVAAFGVEVDLGPHAPGRVTSSMHLQAAGLARQLWLGSGSNASPLSLLANLVPVLEHQEPDLLPLVDLWLFGGHSHEAIARLLDMPLGQARRELSRARVRLQRLSEAS